MSYLVEWQGKHVAHRKGRAVESKERWPRAEGGLRRPDHSTRFLLF